jgi:hypothetical protein
MAFSPGWMYYNGIYRQADEGSDHQAASESSLALSAFGKGLF